MDICTNNKCQAGHLEYYDYDSVNLAVFHFECIWQEELSYLGM